MQELSDNLYEQLYAELLRNKELRLCNLSVAMRFVGMAEDKGLSLEIYEHQGEFIIVAKEAHDVQGSDD